MKIKKKSKMEENHKERKCLKMSERKKVTRKLEQAAERLLKMHGIPLFV